MTELRVALLTLAVDPRPTGGRVYQERIASAAPGQGARVEMVPLSAPGVPPALGAPGALRRAAAGRPDVLLLDSIAAASAGPALTLRRPAVPLVGVLHQPPGGAGGSAARRGVRAWLDLVAYRLAARSIAVSEGIAGELERKGLPGELIRVVPPGVDPPPVARALAPDVRRGRRAAIVSVANWTPQKGILELVEAFAGLPDELATLHLVGDPTMVPGYGTAVRARVSRPDLATRVVVHGSRPAERVRALLASADLFALPARDEPYGIAWTEALAAGLPVVGWRSGNLPSLVRHESEGLLVPTGDRACLARALERLCGDPSVRAAMSRRARARAAGLPTWDQTAERFFDVLREVARSTAPSQDR